MTTKIRQGGRPRTGSFETAGTWPDGSPRFRFRLRLGDGTKSERFDIAHGIGEKEARAEVARMQAAEDARGEILALKRDRQREQAEDAREPHDLETCGAWFKRRAPAYEDQCRWRRHIRPHLGPLVMTKVTRADIERVRDAIDESVRERRIAPKTGLAVWSVLTSAFKIASAGKDRALRVLAVNPCEGVLPPDAGESRRRLWLYPTEVTSLLACELVPAQSRVFYAIACYTYLRPNELAVLEWSDVDLVGNVIRVTKALDWHSGETKAPKTRNGVRTVPIHPSLRPLLERLQGEGRVVQPFSRHKTAPAFREHLRTAGVTRPELFEGTPTTEPVDFRSLRDTGITWLALAGVDLSRIQRRAGHDDMNTTMRYVKAAEDFTESVGEPFPPLPFGPEFGPTGGESPRISKGYRWRRWESKPAKTHESAGFAGDSSSRPETSDDDATTNRDDTRRVGPVFGPTDAVESALAKAIEGATAAGRWDVVVQLARELEARRLERSPNVVPLDVKRGRS